MSPLYRQLFEVLSRRYAAGEARALAFLLLEEGFGVCRTDVYADKVRHFSAEEHQRLADMSRRVAAGEPVQYVLGTAEFCGRRFRVTPATLIPRPETEELVALCLGVVSRRPAPADRPLRLLDAGTGSGCIAISLAAALPGAGVEAWDISEAALAVARDNARRADVPVRFVRQDLLAACVTGDVFDCIVSNPPYVCESERGDMENHVLDHEPHSALFVPDDDPLRFYRALAALGRRSLVSGGALLVEINRAYGAATADLMSAAGYADVRVHKDAFGNDRMVEAYVGE